MAKDTSNVKAGIFVVVVILSDFDRLLQGTQTFKVRFALVDGLKGLKEGASVTIGHHPTGSVVEIVDDKDEQGRIVGKIATIELPDNIKLYDNATVKLNPPPLGGGTSLNIENVGRDAAKQESPAILIEGRYLVEVAKDNPNRLVRGPDDLFPDLSDQQLIDQGTSVVSDGRGKWRLGDSWDIDPPNDVLAGGVQSPQMMKSIVQEVGLRQIERERIRNIIRNADAAMAKVNGILDDNRENLKATIAGLADVMSEKNRENLAQALDVIAVIVKENQPDLRVAVDNLRKLLEKNRPVIDSALAKADKTMEHAQAVLKRVREDTMDRITKAVDNASITMDGARKTVKQFEQLATTQRPALERMIANFRLASDNMKLAAIEIRRAPWRLLYKPEAQEIDTENLYSAARSFLIAADSVETSVASLNGVMAKHGQQIDTSDKNFKRMVDKLKLSVEQFTKVEQVFWDALKDQAPPK